MHDSIIESALDNPVWAALTTRQANLGHGDALARRYHPDVAPFAAVAVPTRAAYQALYQLLQPDEQVILQSIEPPMSIDTLRATHLGMVHQMVSAHPERADADAQQVIRLSQADAEDMLALAQEAKPGPFGKRTAETGAYIGMRDQGRLIAMAGERMCLDGYIEISAVCVAQDRRGQGLAGKLMKTLCREIRQQGATPFLHVFSDNRSALALYERLGFTLRQVFHLSRVSRV